MNCIFCEIVNKREKAEVLYEDEQVLSFLDINPLNFGHTLVITKNHYENFLDVPPQELEVLTAAAQKVSEAMVRSIKPDGFNIVANNGTAAGQSVFHFHFHLIPRFNDDKFKFHHNLKRYPDGEIKKFGEKIRLEIKR